MAQRVQVVLVDDIDGGSAAETVSFAVDGVSYEIDLNPGNAIRLRDALAPWVGSARRVSGRRTRRGASRASGGGKNAEIREWARTHGYSVRDRGRIPADVVAAFEAR